MALALTFLLGVWVGRRSTRPSAIAEVATKIDAARMHAIEMVTQPFAEKSPQFSGAGELENFKATLGEEAQKLNAEERKPLLAAKELVVKIQPQMAEYEASLRELNAAGFVAPATMKTQEELRDRGTLVQRFNTANEALADYFKNAESNYRAALERLGVAGNVKDGVLAGFRRGGNFDVNLKVHEANRQLAATMMEMLKLLGREWGAWKTTGNNEVIFDHEEAVKEFETLQGQLTAAAAREAAAEKELIERTAKTKKH